MQGSCQVLQTIIELAKSGLIFPVPSFIQTFLIAAKDVKQIIRTIGLCIFPIAKLEKSALEQNVLRYNRIKTKTPMSVEVLDTASEMIH